MSEPPPDVRTALQMTRAAKDGDIARALAFAEEFLGHEPDTLLLP